MRSFLDSMMRRLSAWYRRSSIQVVISLSFTLVAVIGMVLLGGALLLRFSSSTDALLAEDSRRVLDQVNLNLDSYLRSMMRVSDTMYYRVIKNADLAEDSIDAGMNLLYETNRDTMVSIAVFSQDGSLVSATPLSSLKRQARPAEQDWFTAAVEKIENLHFSTPHVQNLFEDPDYLYRWVVSLSRGRNLITVGEELEHARHYMTIQKMRFKNKFTSEIRADEEVLGLETVKLVVQPIVENAIYHGMEYADCDGEILVWAHCEGDDLYLDVTDNGPGMPQELVDRLLREDSGPAAPSRRGSGIGLRNVHQRIQLTYGAQYGLEITSEPDEGTTIRIHLPVRRPGEGQGEGETG